MAFDYAKLDGMQKLAAVLAKSTILPKVNVGPKDYRPLSEADVLALIIMGEELGLGPLQAIRGIQVVKGRPTIAAEVMVALVRNRRDVCEYLDCVETTKEKAVWEAKRVGSKHVQRIEFGMEDARKAGLTGSDMYSKFAANMLRWRAASIIVKLVFSDLIQGFYDSSSGELDEGKSAQSPEQVAENSKAVGFPHGFADGMQAQADRDAVEERHNIREPGSDDGEPLFSAEETRKAAEAIHAKAEHVARLVGGEVISPKDALLADLNAIVEGNATVTAEELTGAIVARIKKAGVAKDEDIRKAYAAAKAKVGA